MWWENYSLGLSMISIIEGNEGSQKVAIAMAKAMAMAMIRIIRMVVMLYDVIIGLDCLLCFLYDKGKLARNKRSVKSRKATCGPMSQHIFAYNRMREGVAFVFLQTDFVDGTKGLSRLALMFQEVQDMASEDSLLFFDRHLWFWVGKGLRWG